MGQPPFDIAFVRGSPDTSRVHPDFWRLVEVSGFAVIPIELLNLVDNTPRVYIIPEWTETVTLTIKKEQLRRGYPESPTWVVWWCLDQTLAAAGDSAREAILFDADTLFDDVWISDWPTFQLSGVDLSTRFVLLGGDDRLTVGEARRVSWDVALYANTDADVKQRAKDQGLRLAETPTGDPETLARTKILLNLSSNGNTALSFAIAASHRMAVVSSPVRAEPLVAGVDYVEATDVVTLARRLIIGDAGLPSIDLLAENLHELLVEDQPFAKNVQDAVAELRSAGMN